MTDHQKIPGVVWAITALGFALLVLYATLLPTYRAPDEPEHVELAVHMSRNLAYPLYDGLQLTEQTSESLDLARFGHRELSPDEIVQRTVRPSFDAIGAQEASHRPNRMPQHPPLYYVLMGGFLRTARALGAGVLPYDTTVWLLRVLTAFGVAGLPPLGYLAAVRLSGSKRAGIAAALVPLAIPQLTHIGSSVNNDALLILLSAWLTLLVAQVLRHDWSSQTALLIGLATGLALITKAFALVFPFWILALYVMAWRRGMRWQTVVVRLAQVAAISFVAGGWWWLRNLIDLGRLQASLPAYESVPGVVTRPVWWIGRFAVWITDSFWGWMGWFEAKLPVLLIATATFIVVVTLVVALMNPGNRIAVRRTEVAFLLSPVVLIGAIVAQRAYAVYADTGVTRGIQGRYFFPLVTALAVVLAATWIGASGTRSRFVPLGVLAGVSVMQAVAFVVIVQTYYGPAGSSLGERLGTWLAWSPVPGWAAIGIAASVIAIGAVVARGLARRDEGAALVS